MHLPSNEVGQRWGTATIGHVEQVDACHHLEQFAGYVAPGPVSSRRHVDLAGVRPSVGDKIRNRPGRKRRIYQHDEGFAINAGDWRNIAGDIEIQRVVKRCIDRVSVHYQEKGVAISGRMDDSVGGDIAASAHSILYDEGPAKSLREPLCNEARKYVGRAASSQADDQAHWADRKGLSPSEARYGSDRGQLKECATGNFHGAP